MIWLNKNQLTCLLIAIMALMNQVDVCAQTGPDVERPPIRVPSANAASLGKYGDIPVSPYTGVANVGIPITALQYAGMSVDVSLSYHGGGIKVEEEAGWAGLGWSLNAGGVITRSIRGLDDFPEYGSSGGKGYFKEDAIPSLDHPINPYVYEYYTQGEYTMVHSFANYGTYNYPIIAYQGAIASGALDGQPDIFNFNFNGHSGKFLIDKKRNADESYHVVLYSKEDLKIQLANNDLTGQQGFTITDDAGIVYWFQQREVSRSRSGVSRTGKFLYDESLLPAPGGASELALINMDIRYDLNLYEWGYKNTISSWYLTKIVNPGGAEITFTYDELPEYIRSLPTRSEKVASTPVYGPYGWHYSFTINETKNVYLKQISYPGTTMIFNTSNRTDLQPINNVYGKKLDNIVLSYLHNVKRKWNFSYEYMNSGSGKPDYISKRLKLDFVEQGDGSGIGSKYSFEYNNSGNWVLPDKDSYAQDLYGYYNGKLSNDTKNHFVPTLPVYMTFNAPLGWLADQGVCDRDVHPEFVEAGLLKKISYPTGGNTTFTYESNDFSNGDRMNYYAGNYHLLTGGNGYIEETHYLESIADDIVTQGAGCRIKEITNYEYTGKIASRKAFTYTQSVSGGLSTGKIMFGMKHFILDTWTTSSFYKLFSYNQYANPSSAAGSPIGYSKVQELQYDAQNHYNGYIEYTFENEVESNSSMFVYKHPCPAPTPTDRWDYTPDQSTPYYASCPFPGVARRDIYPINTPNVIHAANGNNIDYSVYNNANQRVYQKVNVYEEKDKEKIKCIEMHPRTSGGDLFNIMFSETVAFKALTQSTVYQDGATNVTQYSYDPNFKHYKPISVETGNSKKETVITNYKYCTDYTSASTSDDAAAGLFAMQYSHILSPIEIIKQKKANGVTTITGAACFEYHAGKVKKAYAASIGGPIPANSFAVSTINTSAQFAKDSRYELKTSVINFNNLGNPNDLTTVDAKMAYIWGYNENYPIAQAVNAKGNEIFFDGFEESNTWNGVVYDGSKSHTGRQSGRMDKPTAGELTYHSTKWLTVPLSAPVKYKYSGWVYSNGPSVDIFLFMKRGGEQGYYSYVDAVSTSTTGQWVFLEKEFTVPADVAYLNIRVDNNGGGTVWFDDIRLHPSSAQMTTYTYDPLVGMSSQTDIANQVTYYEHDGLGRLSTIRDQDRNVIKKLCYNYAGQPENCNVNLYYNTGISGNFNRNNCGSGYAGGAVTYNVYAGTYTSTISQEDADQKAVNDLNANGQTFANERGSCTATTVDLRNYNNTSLAFYATFTNTATGATYNFNLSPHGGGAALITIPIATYNITITPYSGNSLYEWRVGSIYQTGPNTFSATGLYYNNGDIQIDDY